MLRVTPIYGSQWQDQGPASSGSCTLVEYANVRVLINVGGPVSLAESGTTTSTSPTGTVFDYSTLPDHDCLVLSDSTLESLGGLPLYCQAHPDKPVLATFPTVKMGQMTLWDWHAHICLDGGKPPFTLEQMDVAIAQLTTIKYSQAIVLPNGSSNSGSGSGSGTTATPRLSITAHRAAHVVGGAFWVLQRLQDETVVVVTSTYSIAKELHLDSSTLLKHATTPDVLVTRPGGPAMTLLRQLYAQKALTMPLVSQAQRQLTESIMSVLRRDGNVLLPVDASGRVLELVLLLQQFWDKQRLAQTYNLVWLGPMVGNTLAFCRSQLEWMNGKLGNDFDNKAGHPYALRNVHLCSNVSELETLMASNQNPTCVLANGMTLDNGPARDLLLKWAGNDNNAIIFTDSAQCTLRTGASFQSILDETLTDQAVMAAAAVADAETENAAAEEDEMGQVIPKANVSKYSTAFQLLQRWCQAKLEDREMEDSVQVDVLVPRRAPLAGPELKQFLESEEAARLSRRKQEEQAALLREVELAKGRLRLEEDGAGKEEEASAKKRNLNLKYMRPSKKSRFDSSLFLKFSKPLHLTFEVREDAVGIGQKDSTAKFGIGETGNSEVVDDDYGIAVVPEHFVDIVTGVDPSKFAGGSGRIGENVLRRGFGFQGDANQESGKSGGAAGAGEDDANQELADMDERGLEATDLSDGRGIIRGRHGRQPTKVSTEPRRLQVFCEIDYVPLEGRVDSRAARQSVLALQPRQVVVLGGPKPEDCTDQVMTADEVRNLAEAAQGFVGRSVDMPTDSETAELNVGHAAYSVRLIATPYRTQEEKKEEEEPPEPLELHEAKLGACTVSLIDYVATGQRVALDGSIVIAPRKESWNQPSLYLSDGEVLLTDLRTELIAGGMKAEYSTHSGYAQLVVNGKIYIKKEHNSGKVEVEGPLCEDFFSVRGIIRGQYVTL
eukprot:Nitzschia sp. Nitz4//scaffold138_size62050//1928//4771//NITZ4_006381-RA/size62050-processed-gene-0.43-mRNA-1//1//CDS//3329535746//4328//frame0